MARPVNEINAGSMADIAFLLLIFFLVTTTMDVDTGIIRRLPPPVVDDTKVVVNERNIFQVLINKYDGLLVNGEPADIGSLRMRAKEFLSVNHDPNDKRYPVVEEREIDLLGTVRVSKGVISLQNDRGTTYEMYIKVQNELAAAVNELRDEFAQIKFGTSFEKLQKTRPEAYDAIRDAIPVAISEAEPVEIGG